MKRLFTGKGKQEENKDKYCHDIKLANQYNTKFYMEEKYSRQNRKHTFSSTFPVPCPVPLLDIKYSRRFSKFRILFYSILFRCYDTFFFLLSLLLFPRTILMFLYLLVFFSFLFSVNIYTNKRIKQDQNRVKQKLQNA